uniref:Neurotransmitter-gated ion-channel ligand-binding domain-containing protein n=1 Tax=Ciona savignyi TaxID=51511 RepID=H2ZA06_CIOSA
MSHHSSADGDFAVSQSVKAKVDYKGTVEWKPPAIFKTFCEIMVAQFPFDTQNCTMKIGPWSHGQDLLDMVNSDWDLPEMKMYEESGEWLVLKTGCWKHYIKYDCCLGPYVDMTYYFILQRRPLYLVVNILFPTMLFSYLTCAVFYLPSDAGEKMTLSISLLLSLIVFLLVIVEAIPSTANGVPLLCQYILFTMILVCLSIMITVGVLNVHYRGPATHVMSKRMKKDEWKYVAMVLDHFLLYIFILACVVGTVGIFGKRLWEVS